jgi:hypothetical protein
VGRLGRFGAGLFAVSGNRDSRGISTIQMRGIMQKFAGRFFAFAAMVLFLASAHSAWAATFTIASLKGGYSFLLDKWTPDTGSSQAATLGVMTFDGAGNVSAAFTSVVASSTGSAPTVNTGTLSGTYTVNADGTGSMALPGGLNFAIVLDATAGGLAHGIELLQTTMPGTKVSSGSGVLQSVLPKVYSKGSLKGNFAYLQNRWTTDTTLGPDAVTGITTFDGKGGVHTSGTEMSDSGVTTGNLIGSYTVNANGSGTITFPLSGETSAFALNVNGKGFQAVKTGQPVYTKNFVETLTGLKQ